MPEDCDACSGVGASPECRLCPVCALLQGLSTAKPEVTQHLLAAARELTLAFKAIVDAQAGAAEAASGEGRLRRVDLD